MQIDLTNAQNHLDWVKRTFFLNTTVNNAQKRAVKRGCVYNCDLGVGVGSEMQKIRPCIVISNNGANKASPNVIVIPVTHDNSSLPCMVPLNTYTDTSGKTILDGSANTSCIVCVSKARLGDMLTQLDKKDLDAVESSLEASLGMTHRTESLKDEIVRLKKYIGTLLNKADSKSGNESDSKSHESPESKDNPE